MAGRALSSPRRSTSFFAFALTLAVLGATLPTAAQTAVRPRPTAGTAARAATRPAATSPATSPATPRATAPRATATRPAASTRPVATTSPARGATTRTASAPAARPAGNPLLPPQVTIDGFMADLSLVQKLPGIVPAGFEPAYTAGDWQVFQEKFGVEADGITHLRSSGQIAFAQKLIDAAIKAGENARAEAARPAEGPATSPATGAATAPANGPESAATAPSPSTITSATSADPSRLSPGVCRLMLLRAAAIAYRSKEGFPTADKAVAAYLGMMDRKSPAQVGALWTLANAMSRTSATPKADRIRYDAVAARANMQFSLLMLEDDQMDAAQAMIKQVAYHEGWLKSDPTTRTQIARVRSEVKQTVTMMEYLATQYQPAIRNDVEALTAIYFYGRYVKGNVSLVADLPSRVPDSALAQLARKLELSSRGDLPATYAAADMLKSMAAAVPDAEIRQRTLYAALQLYDKFMASPDTEKMRVERTLARIAREAVLSDGAKKGASVDPFAPAQTQAARGPSGAATGPGAPATSTAPAGMPTNPAVATRVFVLPAEDDIAGIERAVLQDGHQPWRVDPAMVAQSGVAWAAQEPGVPAAMKQRLMALTEAAPTLKPTGPGKQEATWDDSAITVALENTRPADPTHGIWLARRVMVK